MKFSAVMVAAFLVSVALPLPAQQAPNLSKDVMSGYDQIKTNLLKAAEEMSEDDYNFQPTKEVRTFGQWIAHVADTQNRQCSAISGSSPKANATSGTAKADLVNALKSSFDTCDAVYNGMTQQNQFEPVSAFRAQMPRVLALEKNITHDNECYGTIAVYMRLKGLVPPSTAAASQMQSGK